MENEFKGRIIFSDNYQSTIDSIKLISGSIGNKASIIKSSNESIDVSNDSDIRIISGYEELTKIKNENLFPSKILAAYDESILELNSLEGKIRCIAHSAVIQNEKEYIPAGFVTLKFFTKSNLVSAKANDFSDIIHCLDITTEINKEYIKEWIFSSRG